MEAGDEPGAVAGPVAGQPGHRDRPGAAGADPGDPGDPTLDQVLERGGLSDGRSRHRRRSSRRRQPRSFDAARSPLPHLDGAVVALGGTAGAQLAGPAAPPQQVPGPGDRVLHLEPRGDQVPDRARATAGSPTRQPQAGIQHLVQLRQLITASRQRAAAPSMPAQAAPASQARRHRCTDRSDTAAQPQSPQSRPAARTVPRLTAGPAPAACGPRRLNHRPAHTSYIEHKEGKVLSVNRRVILFLPPRHYYPNHVFRRCSVSWKNTCSESSIRYAAVPSSGHSTGVSRAGAPQRRLLACRSSPTCGLSHGSQERDVTSTRLRYSWGVIVIDLGGVERPKRQPTGERAAVAHLLGGDVEDELLHRPK